MRYVRGAAAVALVAGVLWAIAWGSTASIAVHGSAHGLLRLAWSARPERVEVCREQTPEALAKLPQHMRQPVLCEGASAHYRLTVRYEGRVVADRFVRGGGLRHDRRLYVFEEVVLDPGRASIEVRFDRVDVEGARSVSLEEDEPAGDRRAGPAAETVPRQLLLETRLQVQPRAVILVTYSPERRALVAVQGAAD
jgi:hypothetical protein